MEHIKELTKRISDTDFDGLKRTIEGFFEQLGFNADCQKAVGEGKEVEILPLKEDCYSKQSYVEFWLLSTPFFEGFDDVPWRAVVNDRFVADPERLEMAKEWWMDQLEKSGLREANKIAETLGLDTYPYNVWDVARAHEVYTSNPITVEQWEEASSPEEVEDLFKGKGCKPSYLANIFFKSHNLPYVAEYISGGGGFSNPRVWNHDPSWGGKQESPHFKNKFWICQWAEPGNAWVGDSGGGVLITATPS